MKDTMQLRAGIMKTISEVTGKNFERDLLLDGEVNNVQCEVTGTADGQKFSFEICATMTVGHATERKKTATPSAETLLAIALDTLSKKQLKEVLEAINDANRVASDESIKIVEEAISAQAVVTMSPVRGSINVANSVKTVEVKIAKSRKQS